MEVESKIKAKTFPTVNSRSCGGKISHCVYRAKLSFTRKIHKFSKSTAKQDTLGSLCQHLTWRSVKILRKLRSQVRCELFPKETKIFGLKF